ncbi:hypothetical protein AB0305_01550 [Arthrobacter sp. NPDC080086]|uniref:hypothetical protein n=1 Tax=Arthrobacter sp. NPDC080086 TaxID=3155917 RepID=UPI00344F45F8
MTEKTDGLTEEAGDFLTGTRYVWSVMTIAVLTAALVLCALYDMFFEPVITQRGWAGASAGILGGVIGGYVFVLSKIVDHENLKLSQLGRGRPQREHAAYLRSRLLLAVPSGFVMSTVMAAIVHSTSPALLTAFGILGGFSCTLLPSLANAAEAAATRYASGAFETKREGKQSRDRRQARPASRRADSALNRDKGGTE